jgi:hypothetical protein
VNPEHLHDAMRDILNAWLRPDVDLRRDRDLRSAIVHAQRLMGMEKRDVARIGERQ